MTSSTKPEVHNAPVPSQEDRTTTKHTDGQTDTLITILRTLTGDEVVIPAAVVKNVNR